MTIITDPQFDRAAQPGRWHRVLKALGRAFSLNASLEARQAEIRHLQAMSDAELAARGLTRDRIVHHVFRDLYDF